MATSIASAFAAARERAAGARARGRKRHRSGTCPVRGSRRDHHRGGRPRGGQVQDAGRHLRHRRFRTRRAGALIRTSTYWCCAPKTPGADVQRAGRGDPVSAVGRQGRRRARRPRLRSGARRCRANDLAAATALLDARFLTGDQALADKFMGAFRARVAKTAAEDFVARLRAEQKARHSRFGDTIFLLEPDLKNGPGRDARPVRRAVGGDGALRDVRSAKELLAQGVMTGRLAQAYIAATEWLMRVRIATHAAAGRRQDHLRFALQEAIAPMLYPEAMRSGRRHPARGSPGGRGADAPVPRPRQVDPQRDRAAAAAGDGARGEAPEDPAGHDARGAGKAQRAAGRRLRRPRRRAGARSIRRCSKSKPSEIMRIFQVAIELDVPVGVAHARAARRVRGVSHADACATDAEAGRRFVELLCDERDRANPSRLEQMQDLGLLAAMMPEWEPSTGRVQHDIYHVYTVDQHALYAVGRLHALASRRSRRRTSRSRARPSARSRDRSRWRWERCCTTSASRTAARTARSAPGSRSRSAAAWDRGGGHPARIEFLVRQHLVMGQMSQRRDLEDLGMISDFAALCGNEENLRELYLLTFCDLASVAPDALTSWKETLLRRAVHAHAHVPAARARICSAPSAPRSSTERQKGAARLLGEGNGTPDAGAGDAVRRVLRPATSPKTPRTRIAAHVRLVRGRREQRQELGRSTCRTTRGSA